MSNLFEKAKKVQTKTNDIDNENDKIKTIENIKNDVLNILNIEQTNLDELDNDIKSIKKDIDLKKEKIRENQSNDKHSASKKNLLDGYIKQLDGYIEHLDRHKNYIKKMIEGQNRKKEFELLQQRLQPQLQQQQKLVDNKIKQCDKHGRFYNDVKYLYNYLKEKYDLNGNHKSIMKALDIKNGDEIIIRAQTTNNGAVIKESVTINEESIKPLESNAQNSIGIEHFDDDDDDDDWNDVDSISSSKTIETGNENQFNNDNIISQEENAVNDYIETIKQIYHLSDYILNKIETIDAVKLGRITPSDNTAKFTNKIYEIIQVFQEYILNIFSNINKINGNIIYYNIFDIIKNNGFINELIRKQTHFINSKNTFKGNYNNPIISKNFQRLLQQEKEFLRIINGDCEYLYDKILENKNTIDEKYIDVYISTNEKIIENISEKIFDPVEGFDDLYKIIFSDRPKSAQSYTNSNIRGSNIKNQKVSKDDNDIPFLNVGRASDYYKNDKLGGSNKKKYTIKRLPNKKYTISKKIKNARLNKTRNRNIRNKNKNKTRINKHI